MIDRKNGVQISFFISDEIHKQIKMLAIRRNISMNLLIQRALIREINRQERNDDQIKE